jgi:hypothetical protein
MIPKSLLVNKAKNLYGTYMYDSEKPHILLFSAEDRKLKVLADIEDTFDVDNYQYYNNNGGIFDNRLIFIGNTLYSVKRNDISAFDLTTYENVGDYSYSNDVYSIKYNAAPRD